MNISGIIRLDKEFSAFAECLAQDLRSSSPLPIVINGLSGGAVDAFITEAVREAVALGQGPVLAVEAHHRAQVLFSLGGHDLGIGLGIRFRHPPADGEHGDEPRPKGLALTVSPKNSFSSSKHISEPWENPARTRGLPPFS